MGSYLPIVVVDCVTDILQGPECNDLLEEIERSIASIRVREIRDSGGSWPRNDRSEEDTNQNGTFHAVQHEEHCKDSG